MNLMTSPWIAIDLGSDRAHVAYIDPMGEVRSILPSNGEFDSLFHVSPHGEIRPGRTATECARSDPEGFVPASAYPLRHDAVIRFSDGRPESKPSILFTALLRQVRQYCEVNVFLGQPLETCILALPHRNTQLRQTYSQIATDAGFTKIHFCDMAIAAETVRQHVWEETFPYMTVCNLGASQISFTLLKCWFGGCDHVEQFHSINMTGIDEIDRIILQSADPGSLAPADSYDALYQLKMIRRNCSFETPEKFHFYLNGRKKGVRTIHFEMATRIFLQKVLVCFKDYAEKASKMTDFRDIPVLLAGGGANNPLIAQAIESVAPGKVFWWMEAEEAGAQGAAMIFLPRPLMEDEKR